MTLENGSVSANPSPVAVGVKTLLDAGAHFGHQTPRWNPKMSPFIYGARNGIHIIDLDLTVKAFKRSRDFLVSIVARGGNALFVGTKPQARDIVKAEATRAGAFYVTQRWLGGTLSNFQTVRNSIERMRKLEDLLAKAALPDSKVKIAKAERLRYAREIEKLTASLGGVREMRRLPEVIFVVDIIKEEIAVAEANRLHIPVIGLVDTNADPSRVPFAIPSNDDASKTIALFTAAMADAVIEGRREYEARLGKDQNAETKQQ